MTENDNEKRVEDFLSFVEDYDDELLDERKLFILTGVSLAVAHSAQVLEEHWAFTLSDRKLFVKLVQEHILKDMERYEQKQPA